VLGDGLIEREGLAPPPGLDNATDEPRHRWGVRRKFPDAAYERLLGGASGPAPAS